MTPASRFTRNGDARIHYLDSGGEDRGAPIVFVPGMTDVADDYVEVLPLFGRRTVVVEVRGHGRSSSPDSGYDLATLSEDVGAIVDAVTDGPVHLVTFSRGTSCAIAWTLAHPDRVLSLAIGDYVPEEKVLTPDVSARLLSGRWRGSPVRERVDARAGARPSRQPESSRSGMSLPSFNFRCSSCAAATASSSANSSGRVTGFCSRTPSWWSSTTRRTTSFGPTVAGTPGSSARTPIAPNGDVAIAPLT